MCTAISYQTRHHYFGRNLDLDFSYKETVTITPRNFTFLFRHAPKMKTHFGIIGMAYVAGDYPLYYDATNEKGLSMAGLRFMDYADYKPMAEGKDNISPFEFIPWILGQCGTVEEACSLLERISLLDENFSEALPLTPLHWIISDKERSITVESVKEGLKIYENPVGVLTNHPTFDLQMESLKEYEHLTTQKDGAIGLPGDWSSQSRFARAVFVKENAVSGETEGESVGQFFHILDAVAQPNGCICTGEQKYMRTIYSSCCNTDLGIYYYITYGNRQIIGVDMHGVSLDGDELALYPLMDQQQIVMCGGTDTVKKATKNIQIR